MARYAQGHKEESRVKIVEAAGRGFRKQGYGGIGVDGLAREAGVTHGAFYGHFRSKEDAFQAAVVAGLEEIRAGVEALRALHGDEWISAFIAFYLNFKRTCDLADACTLPSLSSEVERMSPAVRSAYQATLQSVIATIAAGLSNGDDADRTTRAWALLATLAGGVTMARAVPDSDVSEQISAAVQRAAMDIATGCKTDK